MNNGGRRRVVVTGVGMITPLGATVEKTWEGIRAGRSGIGRITRFDTTGLETTIAGEVRDFDPTQYLDRKEVRRGQADVMLAGGAEAGIIRISIAAFNQARALSTRNDAPEQASRPFDRDRDGFVFSEAAGCVVLEAYEHAKARGAPILAEIIGYGATADAHHVTAPAEGGEGIVRAMRMALDDAALAPSDVAYVNAHGTSTQANDSAETAAIKTVFGPRAYSVAVSSTKSMTGHTLGAAGAIEAIFCVLGMRDGVLPPTINLENPDPECDLDYVPKTSRKAKFDIAMSNSMGFGGHNASLLFRSGASL